MRNIRYCWRCNKRFKPNPGYFIEIVLKILPTSDILKAQLPMLCNKCLQSFRKWSLNYKFPKECYVKNPPPQNADNFSHYDFGYRKGYNQAILEVKKVFLTDKGGSRKNNQT